MPATKPNNCAQILRWTAIALLAITQGASAQFSVPPAATRVAPETPIEATDDHIWLTLDDYVAPETAPGLAHNDLLQHLREGFELDEAMNNRIQAELNWYVKHPDYLNRVFTRSQRYLPHITDELEARGLPLELALLPVVESAYDPFAYSHGRAAGLWQIIPGTGRRFGIEQNWWYDGRRDVVDSTDGALKYLAYLHELMDGDWMLAVASYNSGEGNVMKAVRRNKAKSLPTDFWNLKLSRETSSYVPKLIALVEIVNDPAAYGLDLPEVLNEPQFVKTEIDGQLDLALAAQLAGMELDLLYGFNAGNNRWATDPAGPHRLLIPADLAIEFELALDSVPENERVRWKRHKVKSGDTVGEIAEQYHTTSSSIRAANNFRGNTIVVGNYLMIPVASQSVSEYGKSADARRAQTQNRKRSGSRIDHVVKSGESFWSIGQKYGVGTRDLAAWNGTSPRDTLSIGQTLVVWTNKAAPPSTISTNGTTRKLRYTVRTGDSLYLIASRFRVSINDLVRWNSIDKNKILRPGQKLTMYVDVTAQSS